MIELIIVTNREHFLIPAINSLSADPLGNAVRQAATAKQKTIVLLLKKDRSRFYCSLPIFSSTFRW